jgi:hypothetical protein
MHIGVQFVNGVQKNEHFSFVSVNEVKTYLINLLVFCVIFIDLRSFLITTFMLFFLM